MKTYIFGILFSIIATFAHFVFPDWAFMVVVFASITAFSVMWMNHKEPEYEWPELSFTQDDQIITLTMTKKNGENKRNYLSINRLNLPVREKVVEKTQSSIWHVLGMMPTTDRNAVEKAFRKMSMVYHPDAGGTSGSFQTLMAAKEKALQKCG